MPFGSGSLERLWFQWKALRLPWRKQWLVGVDLGGNTFWEFKDALNANRLRRIVRYHPRTHHADVKVSPQWHQWLRHTRADPPSIPEQQYEVSRQAMMKQLAAEADERWKSVPSYLDSPQMQQPAPAIGVQDSAAHAPPREAEQKEEAQIAVDAEEIESVADRDSPRPRPRETKQEENPWQKRQPKGAPSENWQPENWAPGKIRRR